MLIKAEIIGNSEELLTHIKRITLEEQPFFKPKHIKFIGKISKTKFKLITFNSPPLELTFIVASNNKVKIECLKQSLAINLKFINYFLLYPLILGSIAILLIKWGLTIDMLIVFLLMISLPIIVLKSSSFVYKKFFEPDENIFFKSLEKILEVKITVLSKIEDQ